MAAMTAEEEVWRSPPPEERLASRLAAAEPRRRPTARSKAVTALTELGQLDRAVYGAVAGTPTPVLDPLLRRLSRLADRSRLWVGIAAAMAAVGGRQGRRAAGAGLVAVAVDSVVVNRHCACSPALSATPVCTPGFTTRGTWSWER